MAANEVQIQKFTVSFDVTPPITPNSITISPLNEEHEIPIQPGITMLIFELVTTQKQEGDPDAQFPTYPIEWFVNEGGATKPVRQPECFQVQFYNETRCTIIAFNSALHPENNRHPFNVVVAYKGQTYGSDPTIINEPLG
jgi:hypothetical protein